MNFLWMKISEWLKELLVAGIIGNLSGLFDGINDIVDCVLAAGDDGAGEHVPDSDKKCTDSVCERMAD